MKHCPNCGAKLSNPSQKFCGECGLPIGEAHSTEVPFNASEETIPKKKNLFLSLLNGLLIGVAGFVFLVIVFFSSKTSTYQSSPTSNAPALLDRVQNTYTLRNVVETGFYFNIGLTADELIQKLGEPTSISKTPAIMYTYDDQDSRQTYQFKNNRVHIAQWATSGFQPEDVPTATSDLITDLKQNKFKWVGNKFNNMVYSNGEFEMSVWPVKTDHGTYNIALLAGRPIN